MTGLALRRLPASRPYVARHLPDETYAAHDPARAGDSLDALRRRCGAAGEATPIADGAAETFFETNVRPILVAHCAKCHGADKQSGNLRVDSRAALTTGGDRGPAIVPGDAENSLLVQAIRRGEDLQMPPDDPLPAEAVADLAKWIQSGASWPASTADATAFDKARHWAFQPVVAVEPPADPTGWATTPIDRFIAAGLASHGLKPAAPAAKHALFARVLRSNRFAADARRDRRLRRG